MTLLATTARMMSLVATTTNQLVVRTSRGLQYGDKIALIIYVTVGCLGILFNLFIIKVFMSLKDKSGIKLFIVVLSSNDAITAIAMVTRNLITLTSTTGLSKVSSAMTTIMLLTTLYSQYLLAMIALDRFLAIFYPMTLKMSLKAQIVATIIGLPIAAVIQSSMYYLSNDNDYYFLFLSSICLSFVIMCILYILIIRRLIQHSANNRQKISKTFTMVQNAVAPTEVDSRITVQTNVNALADEHTADKENDTLKQADILSPSKEPAKKNNVKGKLKLLPKKTMKNKHPTAVHSKTIVPLSSSSQQQHKIHLQTVRMTVVITLAYLASYIPWVLSSWYIIPYPRSYLQTFFINVVTSPVLYAFMNRQFKKAAFGHCMRISG